MRVIDTASFIAKSKIFHGDRYDYSRSMYINTYTEVSIICKTHGEFSQNPTNHIKGHGCSGCSGTKKLTNETFKHKAVAIHGLKYSYDKVNYINAKEKVIITCEKHGDFMQSPNKHLMGRGCRGCAVDALKEKSTMGLDVFIERSKEKHGGTYGYDDVIYKNYATPVKIYCRNHGYFKQTPASHLNGGGCRKCATIRAHKGTKKTNAQFVKEAAEKHLFKYDYSKSMYTGLRNKVIITCKKHGDFQQNPIDHLRGRGCQKCAHESRTSYKRSAYVKNCREKFNGLTNLYLIECHGHGEKFYKVGITCTKLIYRFKNSKMPYSYRVICEKSLCAELAWDMEKEIHAKLNGFKYKPSVNFGGAAKECFSELTDEVLEFFGAQV